MKIIITESQLKQLEEEQGIRPISKFFQQNVAKSTTKTNGYYQNTNTGKDVTYKTFNGATVSTRGKVKMSVGDEQTKSVIHKKDGHLVQVNLWRVFSGDENGIVKYIGDDSIYSSLANVGITEYKFVTSILIDSSNREYCIDLDMTSPVKLMRHKEGDDNLKPTSRGNISYGNKIAKLMTEDGEKFLYDKITIN